MWVQVYTSLANILFSCPVYQFMKSFLDLSHCANNSCQNGGTCVDGVGDYACICSADYYGRNCQYTGNFVSLFFKLQN